MDDIEVPLFYILNRKVPKEHADAALASLRITPIDCVIVSDMRDVNLAIECGKSFLIVKSERDALDSAIELGLVHQRRALVIGEAGLLDAYYADGHKEEVPCSC